MSDPVDRSGFVASEAGSRIDPAPPALPRAVAILLSLMIGALAVVIAWRYPLRPGLLIALLALYAAVVWRWPLMWLAAVPAALPAFDLGPWSGWTVIEEPDLVVLVSIAVLLVRAPPARADLRWRSLSGAAIALAAIACVTSVGIALARTGVSGGSAIAELSPLNPLRIAKGLGIALALLPFLRRAVRMHADALALLAAGMVAGLGLVAAAVLFERIVFTGPFDFRTMYRVVGSFSSMRFGGGYVGVFVAMALPFLFVPPPRIKALALIAIVLAAIGGLYTLAVTFARAAYASALLASLVAGAGQAVAAFRRRERRALALSLVLVLAIVGVIAVAAEDARFMERRIDRLVPDLDARLAQWHAGLALRDPGIATTLFGMGLGSYARTVLARHPGGRYPTDIVRGREDGRSFLTVRPGLPLYLGQKVSVAPSQLYRVSATLRTSGRGSVVVILCEKLLLYSINCRDVALAPEVPGVWERFDALLPSGSIGARNVHGLTRPTELSLLVRGANLDIADVQFRDLAGRSLLGNGDFAEGLDRWLPTDDDHAIWRIENQYLTTLFEEGALGVAALLLLAATALLQAGRAVARGDAVAPALAASIVAVLASSLFDCPLDVPRLAALFYLVTFAAFALGERDAARVAPS